MFDFIIIFFVTLISTFLSALSGGGSSLINLPIFFWLGMSFPLATAVQKISTAVWALPAATTYLKDKKIDWPFLFLFGGLGLIGVYLGLQIILTIDEIILKRIIGVLILILSSYTYFNKKMGLTEQLVNSKVKNIFSYCMAVILGIYESLFGAGNGIAFSIVAFYSRGFDFINALGYYFMIGFSWVFFAAGFLISKGYYSINMIPAIIGSVAGGYLGSKLGKYKGNKFIKILFISIGFILGIKLLLNI